MCVPCSLVFSHITKTFNFSDIDVNKQSIILYTRHNMFIILFYLYTFWKWKHHHHQQQYQIVRKIEEPMFAHCVCTWYVRLLFSVSFVAIVAAFCFCVGFIPAHKHTQYFMVRMVYDFVHSCRFFGGLKQFYGLICSHVEYEYDRHTQRERERAELIRFDSLCYVAYYCRRNCHW